MIDELKSSLELKAESIRDLPAVQKIIIASEIGPQVSMSFAAIALCVALLIAPLWGWHRARERDAWWRDEIAKTSAPVRAVIDAGSKQAEANDLDIIKALGETDGKLQHAEQKLQNAGLVRDDSCPIIPARCLR